MRDPQPTATIHRRQMLAVVFCVGAPLLAGCNGVLDREGSRMQTRSDDDTPRKTPAPRAKPIPVTRWGEDGSGAVIVGVHAFGDYRKGFAEIGTRLARAGHTLLAYDQRGFGETPDRGAYASHEAYRADLADVVAQARKIAGRSRPVVIMGESFGGSVALSAMARGEVEADALVLSGPGVREDIPAKPLWDMAIDGAAALFGSGSVELAQSGPMLSPMAQARFGNDPLVVRELRADTYARVVELADLASQEAERINVPTLVLYGEEDDVIARESIDALMRRLGANGTLKVYADRPHLVLQARDRAAVEADILRFLTRISGRPRRI